MKLLSVFLSLFLFLCLTGCIPLRQAVFEPADEWNRWSFVHNGKYGVLQLSDAHHPKVYHLIAEKSWAIGPNGKRYRIETELHEFDVDRGSHHPRDRVYIVTSQGRRIGKLPSGPWELNFVCSGPEGEVHFVYKTDVRTFYYSPFIHGKPL